MARIKIVNPTNTERKIRFTHSVNSVADVQEAQGAVYSDEYETLVCLSPGETKPIDAAFIETTITSANNAEWVVNITGITTLTTVNVKFSGSYSGSGSFNYDTSDGKLSGTVDLLNHFYPAILGETITIEASYIDINGDKQTATNTANMLRDPLTLRYTGTGKAYINIVTSGLWNSTKTTQIAIDWGDGSPLVFSVFSPSNNNFILSKDITVEGQTVKVYSTDLTGEVRPYALDSMNMPLDTGTQINEVVDFGRNFYSYTFQYSKKLAKVPATLPSTLKSLAKMFYNCPEFNDPVVSGWDTSNITDLTRVFGMCPKFNQPLPWNTSNVTKFDSAFDQATSFNQPLTTWDVRKGTSFTYMFYNAKAFNQDLSHFVPLNATPQYGNMQGMESMFQGASSFNQDCSKWCVPLLTMTPMNFSTNCPLIPSYLPVWGTCPRGENIT